MEQRKAIGLVGMGWLILSLALGYMAGLTAWSQESFAERFSAYLLGSLSLLFVLAGLALVIRGLLALHDQWTRSS